MTKSMINLVKQLVGISSVSGDEKKALDFVASWMKEQGFLTIKQTDMFCAGLKKSNNSKRALLLAGHVDTVPANKAEWNHVPIEPLEEDGKMHGLGVSDMKAGVAVNMILANEVVNEEYDTWVVATANEEIDGAGSAEFVKWFKSNHKYEKIQCVIAEPTAMEAVEIGHRGNRFVELTFNGEGGHASSQSLYSGSAIYKLQSFLGDIDKIVNDAKSFSDGVLGSPSLVPSSVKSGSLDAPNQIPATATISLDVRTTPGMDENFDEWFNEIAKKYSFVWKNIANPVGSAITEDHELADKIIERKSGIGKVASPGATDQNIFENAGISTIVFGPGEFSQAHKPNEFIYTNKIEEYYNIMKSVANDI